MGGGNWTATYPKLNSVTSTTAQFACSFHSGNPPQTNQFNLVVLERNAAAPTATQVLNGTDASNTPVPAGFSATYTSPSEADDIVHLLNTSNLTAGHNYDAYFSYFGILLKLVQFTTSDAPVVVTASPSRHRKVVRRSKIKG